MWIACILDWLEFRVVVGPRLTVNSLRTKLLWRLLGLNYRKIMVCISI